MSSSVVKRPSDKNSGVKCGPSNLWLIVEISAAHLPMLWDHTEPFDAGVLQGYIGIESTSYGAMDDRLLLLGE